MCCGKKNNGRARGTKSGKITRSKNLSPQNIEDDKYTPHRERLQLFPERQSSQEGDMGTTEIPRQELLP
jgi:hypothetical protein